MLFYPDLRRDCLGVTRRLPLLATVSFGATELAITRAANQSICRPSVIGDDMTLAIVYKQQVTISSGLD